jgi:hypothetical protein
MNWPALLRSVAACAAIATLYVGITRGVPSVPTGLISFDVPMAGLGFGQGTIPQSINATGEIAGYFADGNDAVHGFVRRKDGSIVTFDAPSASTKAGEGTFAQSINLAGEIAGYYAGSNANGVRHGFVRHTSGSLETFDPPGSVSTVAQSMNDSSEIIGRFSAREGRHFRHF